MFEQMWLQEEAWEEMLGWRQHMSPEGHPVHSNMWECDFESLRARVHVFVTKSTQILSLMLLSTLEDVSWQMRFKKVFQGEVEEVLSYLEKTYTFVEPWEETLLTMFDISPIESSDDTNSNP